MPASTLRTAAGIVVAVVFLWLAFGRVDWNTMTAVLANADAAPLAVGLVALAGGLFVRIVRWWVMLRALEPDVRLAACVRPFLISLAINNTMPLRAGDVARAVAFRKALRSPVMRVVGSLVIERVLDLFVLLTLFFVGLLALGHDAIPRAFVMTAVALGIATLAGLLVLVVAPGRLGAIVERIASSPSAAARPWMPRAREAAQHLFATFALIQSPARALGLLGLSLLAWLLEGAMYACVAWSLHANASPIAPWFAAATGTLATLIPSSPGYVGTFDYFAMLGMTAFGTPRVAATAFAMVVHLMLWLPVTVIGAALLGTSGATSGATGVVPRSSRQRSAA